MSGFIVEFNLEAFREAVAKQARPILFAISEDEKRLEVLSFGLPKSGRAYYRGKGRGKYTASAPGEAPAIRTGNLFRTEGDPKFTGTLTVERVIGAEYTEILENHLNRPFIGPAIESVKQRFAAGQIGRFA